MVRLCGQKTYNLVGLHMDNARIDHMIYQDTLDINDGIDQGINQYVFSMK